MRNLIFYFCFIFLWSSLYKGQDLHITYTYISPLHAKVKEDLYINGNEAKDIRDSVFVYEKAKSNVSQERGGIGIRSKNKMYTETYYKSALSNKILIKSNIADQSYWIKDILPEIQWNTDYNETKIINNYLCKKATCSFRGSSLVAYYTTELPYPFGPFKFGGLPGLILEVGEEKTDINRWTVTDIIKNSGSKTDTQKPQNIENVITYQEFLELYGSANRKDVKKLTNDLPKGVIVSEFRTVRKGIEKKYEWE